MGDYVNGNKVTISGTVDVDNLKQEIADLIGVPPREEGQFAGRIVSSDLCISSGINIWAKDKPFLDVAHSFESDTARDNARKLDFYGLRAEENVHPDNAYVYLVEWEKKSLTGYPKRLRDFNGYNHSAKSGVLIKNAPSVNSDIVLETNPDTGDNITMSDVLDLTDYGNASRYDWVVVDSFGFIHPIPAGGYTSKDALKNYLFGSSTKLSVNIYDDYTMQDNYRDTSRVPAPPSAGIPGYYWTIGLMAKGRGSYWPNTRIILNPEQFRDSRLSLGRGVVSCTGFTPNMVIGTAAHGRTRLADILYGDVDALDCCTDDFLFLGCEIKNIGTGLLSMRNIRVLLRTTTVVTKSIQLCRYDLDVDTTLAANASTGVTMPGLDPTGWADGMCYIRLNAIWNHYNAYGGTFAIAYYNEDALIGQQKFVLLTPWVTIGLKNNGKNFNDLDRPNAALPDVRPVPNWTDLTI